MVLMIKKTTKRGTYDISGAADFDAFRECAEKLLDEIKESSNIITFEIAFYKNSQTAMITYDEEVTE